MALAEQLVDKLVATEPAAARHVPDDGVELPTFRQRCAGMVT